MATESSVDDLDVGDNPSDARRIKEMLKDSAQLLQRLDLEDWSVEGLNILHEQSLASGIERTTSTDVDVILLDLGLPDSRGVESLTEMVEVTDFVPIVVLTGLNDEEIGIKSIQHGAQDYLVKDDVTRDLLFRSIHYAIERNRQTRERARQRPQLESLNQLNEIGQAISHTVISKSRREELEQAVCDKLTEPGAYRFAWIGDVDPTTGRVTPRVCAGIEDDQLQEIQSPIEGDGVDQEASTADTDEIRVVQTAQTDPPSERWREEAVAHGFHAAAAVPIQYEEYRYGVLNIYADSAYAFSEPEATILTRLGDVIGHAIAAIERREVLESDKVLELEFTLEGVASDLVERTSDGERSVSFDSLIRTDETVLGYGRAVDISESALREGLTEASLADEIRVLSSGDRAYNFEFVSTTIEPVIDAISTHGGRIDSATIADGTFRFVVAFSPGRDKRQLVDLVLDHCDSAVHSAQRLVERSTETSVSTHSIFLDSLTPQQRRILETAYRGGLFAWPRESTEAELAERLGISSPTFNQHLRAAEQKFFEEVFSEVGENVPPTKP
jgi:predicted DNA binding protein/DNA-binding NarL/FixJ family response regulator